MKKITKTIRKRLKRLEKKKIRDELKQKKINLVNEMFIRDEGLCVFCKKPVSKNHYQTCHIIPYEFKETRYDINNILLACFYHHKVGKQSMHQHPLWFNNWLKNNRPEQYEYLIKQMGLIHG